MKERFSSRIGLLMTAIAGCVGLGNMYRFPWKVGSYGGGTFLFIYLIILVLLGIPLVTIELFIGKHTGLNPSAAFAKLAEESEHNSKFWKFFGEFNIFSILWVHSGAYFHVVGFCLGYMILSFFPRVYTTNPEGLFAKIYPGSYSLVFTTLVAIIMLIILTKGIKKGLEKCSKFMLPIISLSLLIIAIRSITLPGAKAGIEWYLAPSLDSFLDPVTWLQAIGQVFFSTTIACTFLITWGRYMRKEDQPMSSGTITCIGDTLIALLAGFAIIPLCFAVGIQPEAGFSLSFILLPKVFSLIPMGYLIAPLFYISFFFAALTSHLPAFETNITFLMDTFNWKRRNATILLVGIGWALASVSCFSVAFFSITDWGWTILLPLIALGECILVGWLFGGRKTSKLILGKESKWLEITIKYIAPIIITIIFVFWLADLISTLI
jgi:NSS family neurotransmitter:Na+ symporter